MFPLDENGNSSAIGSQPLRIKWFERVRAFELISVVRERIWYIVGWSGGVPPWQSPVTRFHVTMFPLDENRHLSAIGSQALRIQPIGSQALRIQWFERVRAFEPIGVV